MTVLERAKAQGHQRLVAYVVAGDSAALPVEELRRYLAGKLPDYMIPHAFVWLDDLPLTASGKVDRNALPAPDPAPANAARTPPRTTTESVLADTWAELLNTGGRPGVHDNLFAMGGDSILATKIIMRLRATLHVEIPVRAIFESPTIAGLAAFIDGSKRTVAIPPVVPVPRTGRIPMSSGQQRLWLHDRLDPGSLTYNTQEAVRLVGDLNLAALQQAIDEIVRRHEVLRTTFAEVDGHPIQVVVPPWPLDIAVSNLSDHEAARQDEEVTRVLSEDVAIRFDLECGPLVHVRLVHLSRANHILAVTIHHIVSDDWTGNIFVDELVSLYRAFSRGEPSPLEEPKLHYADFAVWEQEQVRRGSFQPHVDYWKKQLAGDLPVLRLPVDHVRPPAPSGNGGSLPFSLSEELTAALRQVGRRADATLFMTLLAAWQTLLSYFSGQKDILVGSPTANRVQPELADVVGFFVNTLVMRGDFSGNPTFVETLRRTRETALNAYTHQAVPLDRVVAALRGEGRELPSPIFRAWFALHNIPRVELDLGGVIVSDVVTQSLTDVHDLKLWVVEHASRLEGAIDFRRNLFEPTSIARMMKLLEFLLRRVAEDPGIDLAALSAQLAAKERQLAQLEEQAQRVELARGLRSVRRQLTRVAPNQD